MVRTALADSTDLRPGVRPKVRYPTKIGFYADVRQRVDAYLLSTRGEGRDAGRMYTKTAILFFWLIGSYTLLTFFASTWWQMWPLAISLGLAVAGVGFNIQHDGNHGAYSNHSLINRLMALTLDMVGGSSYVWHHKHNVLHHTYTNVTGLDDDIEKHPWARLSPHQPRSSWNRFQHFYMWVLYGLSYFKWAFLDDFRCVIEGKISGNPIPRPSPWNLSVLILGKAFFFSWVFVVPMLFHPWWGVLGFYLAVSFMGSVIMSIVFQLAHCVGEAEFPVPAEGTHSMAKEWAAHQVESSVDFSRSNRFLGWYLGGLNFQIEHHLFPHVSHVHYAAISRLVEETAQKHSVRYFAHPTLFKALASHARWLRRMGTAPLLN